MQVGKKAHTVTSHIPATHTLTVAAAAAPVVGRNSNHRISINNHSNRWIHEQAEVSSRDNQRLAEERRRLPLGLVRVFHFLCLVWGWVGLRAMEVRNSRRRVDSE